MPADAKLVRELFLAAAELPVDQRATYLTTHCGDDVELQAAVERLLAAHEQPASVLVRPAPGIPTADYVPISEKPGTKIGPYKLMEQIGEGGFGLVFVAEQTEPVKRRVAIKIIKPGMDSRAVIARFEAERQALAMMDHPNIARVLDGGSTETGRPYFVMELVRGIAITEYCDQHQLTPDERLELFVDVCHAIQHAHQKGVIHRDIKPSNVLVTSHDGKPVAKVIDFGVAKAISQQLTERTIYTQFAQMIGTPLYMSPEQAEMSGLDIDTRSDIYSLGVLLYELLTGSTPLEKKDVATAAYDEIRRLIREEEPPRPSHRLSACDTLPSLAANRRTEPAKLSRMLKGELDWVVMKALEKERTRRYETPSGLAQDVQRYLADEIVEARPPSTSYRLRKLARKHRAALTTAAAIILLLLTGATVGTWQAIRATAAEHAARAESVRAAAAERAAQAESMRAIAAEEQARHNEAAARDQEQQAQRKAAEAQALIGFISSLTWEGSWPFFDKSNQRDRSYFEALSGAEPQIAVKLRDYPLAEAQLRVILGDLYWGRGNKAAITQYKRALELRRQELGLDHDQTFEVMDSLASTFEELEDWKAAVAMREECVAHQTRLHGPLDSSTLRQRIWFASGCYWADDKDRRQAAMDALERDLGTLKARGEPLELNLLTRFLEFGQNYIECGETEKALRWYHEAGLAFGTGHERFRKDPQAAVDFILDLANHLAWQKQTSEALRWYERYADALRAGWKKTDGSAVKADWLDFGILIRNTHRPEDLERIAAVLTTHVTFIRQNEQQDAWTGDQRGNADSPLARSLTELGRCRLKQGRYVAAESPLRESLATPRMTNSRSYTTYETTQYLLGGSLLGQKKYAEAEPYLLAGFEGLKEQIDQMKVEARAPQLGQAAEWLVELYTAIDKPDELKKWQAEQAEQQQTLRAARALSLMQTGQVAEAVAEVAELPVADASTAPKWTALEWYNFACIYAVASGKLSDKKQQYADRAMEFLHQAVKSGYKDVPHMKQDTDLDPLRDRADFKKLLVELEGKAP